MGWIAKTMGALVIGGACFVFGVYEGYKVGQYRVEEQLNAQPYRVLYQDADYKFKDNNTGNIFGIEKKSDTKIKLDLEQRTEQQDN